MAKHIHIIVAESSTIIRCGLVTLLQRANNITIDVAEVSDIANIAYVAQKQMADMVIINPAQLGNSSPSSLRAELNNDSLRIVALQSSFTDQAILQSYDDVISIYDSADSITEKIASATRSETTDIDSKRDLSAREREIIVCVVKGMTNKQIADTLCLSTHTIIAHRRNIASKLKIHSPSGLTIYAIVNKLVDIGEIKNSISQNKEME